MGIAIGGVAILLIASLFFICCNKRKRRRRDDEAAYYVPPPPGPKGDIFLKILNCWHLQVRTGFLAVLQVLVLTFRFFLSLKPIFGFNLDLV